MQFFQLHEKIFDRFDIFRVAFEPDMVFAGGDADVEFFLNQFEVEIMTTKQFRNEIIIFENYFFGIRFQAGVSLF